jgi:uncharacterized protein YegL
MNTSWSIVSEQNGFSSCAIRIATADSVEHTATHYVLLIDVSESMDHESKLENVKRCLTILVSLLKNTDMCSLITFGSSSEILLNRVMCGDVAKESIRLSVQALRTNGCTNLSAGLINVHGVIQQGEKTGLFLLTDGIANKGLIHPTDILKMMETLKTKNERLSVASIAYGMDHNANLMKQIAETMQGNYVIVDSIESTAFAFGGVLGGLMSCVAQLTNLWLPEGSTIHGPYKNGPNGISIGDLYAGTETLLLAEIPTAKLGEVRLCATLLPSLQSYVATPSWQRLAEPSIEIELTVLRYSCSTLLGLAKEYRRMSLQEQESFKNRVQEFETKLSQPNYATHPITATLLNELPVLHMAMEPVPIEDMEVLMTQHATTIGLGRGFSTPVRPRRRHMVEVPRAPGRRSAPIILPGEADDVTQDPINIVGFQNSVMREVGSLMRSASQTPDEF